MSVLIKGMEMPKSCHECRLYEGDIYYCSAADKSIDISDSSEGKCQFCPLIPAADVRPVVKAKWEKVTEQPYLRKHYHVVACSACHKRGNQGWKYCPNCGAKMEGVT